MASKRPVKTRIFVENDLLLNTDCGNSLEIGKPI